MYLCKTDGLNGIENCPRHAFDEYENAGAASGTNIGSVFRIGVLIAHDFSSIDVAKVLAKTCERFNAEQRKLNNEIKISVTLIADRAGFLIRENSSIPVWCEAIGDVNPKDFHYFVVPRPGIDGFAPQSEMISWLAQVRGEAKLISLPLDVDADPNAGHSLKCSDGAGKIDAVHADPRTASRIAIDESGLGVTGVRRSEQRSERLNTPQPSERIKATIDWLSEHFGSRISIPKLAERTLMSERNFLRRFRAEVGRSPHEYLCQIRLENARQLLINTALPVDKIARHCGLFNGDHLRKHFLKHFGMTPSEYRKTHFHALQSSGSNEVD